MTRFRFTAAGQELRKRKQKKDKEGKTVDGTLTDGLQRFNLGAITDEVANYFKNTLGGAYAKYFEEVPEKEAKASPSDSASATTTKK